MRRCTTVPFARPVADGSPVNRRRIDHRVIHGLLTFSLVSFIASACGDSSSPTGPTPPTAGPSVLASGQLSVLGAPVILGRSLHVPFTLQTTAPTDLGPTSGRVLAVVLQDASSLACESRCPSIDWADQGANFPNQLTVATAAGQQVFFMTENGGLAANPDNPSQV